MHNEMAIILGKMISENATRRAQDNSHGPYTWERIEPSTEAQGFHFRIADCNDNLIVIRYTQDEAEEAVRLLNSGVRIPFKLV